MIASYSGEDQTLARAEGAPLLISLELAAFLFYSFMHLFLAGLGLCCCAGFSLVEASRGCSLVAVCEPLFAVASLVADHRLYSHGLSS